MVYIPEPFFLTDRVLLSSQLAPRYPVLLLFTLLSMWLFINPVSTVMLGLILEILRWQDSQCTLQQFS